MTVESKGVPTRAEVLEIYREHGGSVRNLHARLKEMGYTISVPTVGRILQKHLGHHPGPVASPIKQAMRQQAKQMVGEPMDLSLVEKDRQELTKLEVPALREMLEKERLVYTIMMLRSSQRKADVLVLMPRDTAAMVTAMSEAENVLNGSPPITPVPDAQPEPDTSKMITVSPSPPNEVAAAIGAFLKKEGVAA
jgi:hypothetical protein